MSGDLRLGCVQDFNEVADAHLLFSHEVEQAETGVVAERLKELLHVE
jgi:hypothetical protein